MCQKMIETAQALMEQAAAQTNDVIVIPPAQETKIENKETKQNKGVSQETKREDAVTEIPKPEAANMFQIPLTNLKGTFLHTKSPTIELKKQISCGNECGKLETMSGLTRITLELALNQIQHKYHPLRNSRQDLKIMWIKHLRLEIKVL